MQYDWLEILVSPPFPYLNPCLKYDENLGRQETAYGE